MGLFLGELLEVAELAGADFPELIVEPEEDDEEDGGDDALVGGEAFGDHEKRVEGAVEKGGEEECLEDVGEPIAGLELGEGEIVAHDYGEEEVAGDAENGSHAAGGEGGGVVGLVEDIEDVFESGEAEGDKGGIDDAVEIFVEVLAVPDDEVEHDELAEFLAETGDDESLEESAEDGGVGGRGEGGEDAFEDDGRQGAEDAGEDGLDELLGRFLVDAVFEIDEGEEDDDWEEGEDD